jgi:uncharacterized protein (UPF0335 family)
MSMSQQELFDRLVTLESEKITLTEDIKQLKADCVYNEDTAPNGLLKDDIKLIAAASKLEAQNQYEQKKEASDAVFQKYVELTGYNS